MEARTNNDSPVQQSNIGRLSTPSQYFKSLKMVEGRAKDPVLRETISNVVQLAACRRDQSTNVLSKGTLFLRFLLQPRL